VNRHQVEEPTVSKRNDKRRKKITGAGSPPAPTRETRLTADELALLIRLRWAIQRDACLVTSADLLAAVEQIAGGNRGGPFDLSANFYDETEAAAGVLRRLRTEPTLLTGLLADRGCVVRRLADDTLAVKWRAT
jgi:hypothetical protein